MRVKGGGRGSGGSGGSGGRGTFDGFWVTGSNLIARSQGDELAWSKERGNCEIYFAQIC